MRAWGLALAAFGIFLTAAALVAVDGAYDGMAARDRARSPTDSSEAAAELHYVTVYDELSDLRQFTVVYLEPRTDNAPLPPGLDSWLQPGEAALSPALAAALAEQNGPENYGRVTATIAPDGLIAPTERFAYVRPPADAAGRDAMTPASSFGSQHEVWFGVDHLNARPAWVSLLLIASLLGIPSLVLLVVAARIGSTQRARRLSLLLALGASTTTRVRVITYGALWPTLTGMAAVGAFIGAAATINLPIPFASFSLNSTDVRANLPLYALAAASSLLLVLATCALLNLRHNTDVRPRPKQTRLIRTGLTGLTVSLLATIWSPLLAGPNQGVRLLLYVVGVLAIVATVPDAAAQACLLTGRSIAHAARRLGWPGMLVGARQLAARSSQLGRLIAGVAVAIIVLGQVQLWTSFLSTPVAEARGTHQRIGDSLLEASLPEDRSSLEAFLDRLPADVAPLFVTSRFEEETGNMDLHLHAPCATLRLLDLPCGSTQTSIGPEHGKDIRVQEVFRWVATSLTTSQTDPEAGARETADTLWLISTSGSDIDTLAVEAISRDHFVGGLNFGSLGAMTLGGSETRLYQGRWVSYFGTIGILIAFSAAGLNGAAYSISHARSLISVGSVAGRSSLYRGSASIALGVPLFLAATFGTVSYWWAAIPISGPSMAQRSLGLASALWLTGLVVATILTGVAATLTASQAGRWRGNIAIRQ